MSTTLTKQVAERLREAEKNFGLPVNALTGVPRFREMWLGVVDQIEAGNDPVDLDELRVAAEAASLKMWELFTEEEPAEGLEGE